MKISGFSFVRNGTKLYYPVKESVQSILPIVDEFVIAVGNSDADDKSREDILSIGSDKVRIIDTVWDEKFMQKGAIHALQTDIAMNACSGDWLFYLQADEVVHENDLPVIESRCKEFLDDDEVEGFLFDYYHFWADYEHYHKSHGWYPYEVRIVRNNPKIHSWESAQSFRYFEHYEKPHQNEGTRKLRVVKANANIYHYGWVRPPELMQAKSKAIDSNHKGIEKANELYINKPKEFDYGPLNRVQKFEGTHPKVMKNMIQRHHWKDKLQYSGAPDAQREPHMHEKFKYRLVTFIENKILNRPVATFKNFELLNK
ncbi:MAG: hypothetical protein KIT33_07040 [Candidatus Kapabacteria bacterium]|nr:hypothetical protein [Ignavibacteriota bacterium]MCW5884709.1 hypothetical protein [Candidatus Kapabacteria bacterium]